MKKNYNALTLLITSLLIFACDTEKKVYVIENKFEAFFPGEPKYIKTVETDLMKTIYYTYEDEDNLIAYRADYVELKQARGTNGRDFLISFSEGLVDNFSGKFLKRDFRERNGYDEVIYTIEYQRDENIAHVNGVTILGGNSLYVWEVIDYPELSYLHGDAIFEAKLLDVKIVDNNKKKHKRF